MAAAASATTAALANGSASAGALGTNVGITNKVNKEGFDPGHPEELYRAINDCNETIKNASDVLTREKALQDAIDSGKAFPANYKLSKVQFYGLREMQLSQQIAGLRARLEAYRRSLPNGTIEDPGPAPQRRRRRMDKEAAEAFKKQQDEHKNKKLVYEAYTSIVQGQKHRLLQWFLGEEARLENEYQDQLRRETAVKKTVEDAQQLLKELTAKHILEQAKQHVQEINKLMAAPLADAAVQTQIKIAVAAQTRANSELNHKAIPAEAAAEIAVNQAKKIYEAAFSESKKESVKAEDVEARYRDAEAKSAEARDQILLVEEAANIIVEQLQIVKNALAHAEKLKNEADNAAAKSAVVASAAALAAKKKLDEEAFAKKKAEDEEAAKKAALDAAALAAKLKADKEAIAKKAADDAAAVAAKKAYDDARSELIAQTKRSLENAKKASTVPDDVQIGLDIWKERLDRIVGVVSDIGGDKLNTEAYALALTHCQEAFEAVRLGKEHVEQLVQQFEKTFELKEAEEFAIQAFDVEVVTREKAQELQKLSDKVGVAVVALEKEVADRVAAYNAAVTAKLAAEKAAADAVAKAAADAAKAKADLEEQAKEKAQEEARIYAQNAADIERQTNLDVFRAQQALDNAIIDKAAVDALPLAVGNPHVTEVYAGHKVAQDALDAAIAIHHQAQAAAALAKKAAEDAKSSKHHAEAQKKADEARIAAEGIAALPKEISNAVNAAEAGAKRTAAGRILAEADAEAALHAAQAEAKKHADDARDIENKSKLELDRAQAAVHAAAIDKAAVDALHLPALDPNALEAAAGEKAAKDALDVANAAHNKAVAAAAVAKKASDEARDLKDAKDYAEAQKRAGEAKVAADGVVHIVKDTGDAANAAEAGAKRVADARAAAAIAAAIPPPVPAPAPMPAPAPAPAPVPAPVPVPLIFGGPIGAGVGAAPAAVAPAPAPVPARITDPRILRRMALGILR